MRKCLSQYQNQTLIKYRTHKRMKLDSKQKTAHLFAHQHGCDVRSRSITSILTGEEMSMTKVAQHNIPKNSS